MTDLEYWRSFLDWVDVYDEMYPNDPAVRICGFATMFARRRYEAALRDADRDSWSDPGGEP